MSTKSDIRRAERTQRRESRRKTWREIRCFWTWPFGHAHGTDGKCVGCGVGRRINL